MLRQGLLSAEEVESRVPQEQLDIYRKAFSVYDINGDGVIEIHELFQVMTNLGVPMDETDLHDILMEMGIGDKVDFRAFLQIMFFSFDNGEETLRASFKLFDTDGDGFIGVGDCKYWLFCILASSLRK